jgi:hypothetical protein
MIELPKGFWAGLCRNPTDWTAHLVIADYCEDHDDLDQAKAWRYLAKRKKTPCNERRRWNSQNRSRWVWYRSGTLGASGIYVANGLPQKLFGGGWALSYHEIFRTHKEAVQWAIRKLIETGWIGPTVRNQEEEMISKEHPDVMLYYSYDSGVEKIHVRIVTFETPSFRHGLGLEGSFSGPNAKEEAEKCAMAVQEYVDLIRETGRENATDQAE